MKNRKNKRIAVIGGGASGMMAAITAARQGAFVVIYESKERLGKKILATGNGKCNFTNLIQEDACYRGTYPEFSKKAREAFNVEDTLAFFREIGIEPKIKNGYVYPRSEQAASVADALSMEIRSLQIEVISETVTSIEKKGAFFELAGHTKTRQFDRVILSCGSCAGMKDISQFHGYDLVTMLGHHLVPVLPALVQLRCKEKWFKTISGVRTEGVVKVYIDKQEAVTERGELLFAEYGLSGIPIFQISRFVSSALHQNHAVSCSLDLLPEYSKEQLTKLLETRKETLQHRTAEEVLVGLLHHKLNYVLLKECGIDPLQSAQKAFEKKESIERFASVCKHFTCHVTESNPFSNAQICAGGANTKELNSETMESNLVKGLYMTGELVDVDGTCGGYNLQWAWSSGYVAGFHAANSIN